MKTSYYFSPKLNENQNLIAISKSIPNEIRRKFLNIRIYSELCPSWKLVSDYKSNKISKEMYTEQYIVYYLNSLNPINVYDELGNDAILLCWEQPRAFCHRRIVANWFETNLKIKVDEL